MQAKVSKKLAERASEKSGDTQKGAKKRARSSVPEAASSSSARRPLPQPAPSQGWTMEQLKDMMPPGGSMSREKVWASRWRCSYPCAKPNASGHVYSSLDQEINAQKHCLRFLWACHKRVNPDAVIPWEGLDA
eukprot:6466628-Amphidinium_carterae.3